MIELVRFVAGIGIRRILIPIGAVTVVGALVIVAAGGAVPPQWPDARFGAFLRAAAGGDEDRGWSFVSDFVRKLSYDNVRDAYVRDAEAADWAAFRWAEPEVRGAITGSRTWRRSC